MMLFTELKKSLTQMFRKKKQGYAVFSSDVHIRGAAAENTQYKPRYHRLAKIRQRIQGKKKDFPEEYHRPAKKKSYGRFIILGVLILAVPLGWFFGGGDKVRQSLQSISFFKVAKIEVSGCAAVAQEKILEASGIITHQTSLLALDVAKIESSIATVPWVAKVMVKKRWPAKIQIVVEENAPVALLHTSSTSGLQLQYMDGKGKAFSTVNPGGEIDFPVVTGLTERGDLAVREKALAEILIFLSKVRGNDPHLPAHSVSELHVTKTGELVVYLVDYPFPIFFGNGNTKEKYSRLIQVLRALYKKQNSKELLSQIKYIQMDYFNDKVLVVESGSE